MTLILPLFVAVKIGSIDFFGYGDADLEALRAKLPVHIGDTAGERIQPAIRRALPASTDQALVCCNQRGEAMIYIGLGGQPSAVRPTPTGRALLPKELLRFDADLEKSWVTAVQSQNMKAVDAKLLDARALAARLETTLLEVVDHSANARHRGVAAFYLGHAMDPDERRLRALLDASLDADDTVRNNAVRGLGEWARRHPAWRGRIPASPFIAMLNSGIWTDLNKASGLLLALTDAGEPGVLEELRAKALPRLREMALWDSPGHHTAARLLLERIAKLPAASP